MKTLKDLSSAERNELKQRYLSAHNESVSTEELANADALVSDEELEQEYGETSFVEDDFWCNIEDDFWCNILD